MLLIVVYYDVYLQYVNIMCRYERYLWRHSITMNFSLSNSLFLSWHISPYVCVRYGCQTGYSNKQGEQVNSIVGGCLRRCRGWFRQLGSWQPTPRSSFPYTGLRADAHERPLGRQRRVRRTLGEPVQPAHHPRVGINRHCQNVRGSVGWLAASA